MLVRLLILGLDVPTGELTPAISPLTIDDLVRLRVIERRGDVARPLVRSGTEFPKV